jgi:queuine/archaeosine tRNA-ribosyltransferase
MVYGTDLLKSQQAFNDIKDFYSLTQSDDKLRAFHGTGNPAEILNALMAGADIFESDFPLSQAANGFALNIQTPKK